MTEFCVLNQPLPEVFLLECPFFPDKRGNFAKIFNSEFLLSQGISFTPAESFLTRSNKEVLRGMHFQNGISAHEKLVTCIKGTVLDVVVDVRPDSLNFNKPFSVELSESSNKAILIGKGYAHGFLVLDNDSWILYSTTTVHNPTLDCGVLWDSIAFEWPCSRPLLSERDKCHPKIQDFT